MNHSRLSISAVHKMRRRIIQGTIQSPAESPAGPAANARHGGSNLQAQAKASRAGGGFTIPLLIFLALLAGSQTNVAGEGLTKETEAGTTSNPEAPNVVEKLWDLPILYKNKKNPVVQQLALVGRYHGQWHTTSSNTGEDRGWENRRARLGVKAKLFRYFEFETQFDLNLNEDEEEDFVEDVDTLTLEFAADKDFYIIAGKQKVKITDEFATSSNKILTFERSLLVNQIVPERVGGVVVGKSFDSLFVEGGIYSGNLDEDLGFPELGGSYGFSLRCGYSLSRNSAVRLDYFHSGGGMDSEAFSPYRNIVSLNTNNKWDRWGFSGDLLAAEGAGNTPGVYGLVLMPYRDLTANLRAVLRYHYAGSESSEGVTLQKRYERAALTDGSGRRGRDYHSVYGGLNYHIHGDKLKLMSGLEYATMKGDADYSGWTVSAGCRLSF